MTRARVLYPIEQFRETINGPEMILTWALFPLTVQPAMSLTPNMSHSVERQCDISPSSNCLDSLPAP